MNETVLVAIVAALTTIISGGAGVAFFNRRKTRAEAGVTEAQQQINLAKEAMDIMKQTLDNTVAPLHRRIDELEESERDIRAEVECQAKTLDDLNAKITRLQLAFIVNESYIKSLGHTPPVALRQLDKLSTNELRDIASTMKNIERRRQGDDTD